MNPDEAIELKAVCVICGASYEIPRTTFKRKTCGRPECRGALAARNWKAKERAAWPSEASIEKARVARAASPKAGRFQTHALAKDWHLVDPVGTEHRFRNLNHFIREHRGLFDPADTVSTGPSAPCRAAVGLGRLRPDHQKPAAVWKGWRWGDPAKRTQKRARWRQPNKPWALRAPDGTEFRFLRFEDFVATEAGRFSDDDLRVYASGKSCRARTCLAALRPSPKRRHKSWKGWTWIEVDRPAKGWAIW